MNRLQRLVDFKQGKFPWQTVQEVWEVLTPDLREQEFQGSYEECLKYLKSTCPNGSCEE